MAWNDSSALFIPSETGQVLDDDLEVSQKATIAGSVDPYDAAPRIFPVDPLRF